MKCPSNLKAIAKPARATSNSHINEVPVQPQSHANLHGNQHSHINEVPISPKAMQTSTAAGIHT